MSKPLYKYNLSPFRFGSKPEPPLDLERAACLICQNNIREIQGQIIKLINALKLGGVSCSQQKECMKAALIEIIQKM